MRGKCPFKELNYLLFTLVDYFQRINKDSYAFFARFRQFLPQTDSAEKVKHQ